MVRTAPAARRLPLDQQFHLRFHLLPHGGNAAYAEQLYENYTRDPNSVDPQWQSFLPS